MNKSNVGASSDTTHLLTDILMLTIAFAAVMLVFSGQISKKEFVCFFVLAIVHSIIYILSNKEQRVYNVTLFYYLDRIFRMVTKSFVIGAIASSAMLYYVSNVDEHKEIFLYYLLIGYILVCLNAIFFHSVIDKALNKDHMPRTAFVGKKDAFNKFRYFLNKTSILVEPIGFIYMDEDEKELSEEDLKDYIGKLSDLEDLIREYNIDQIYMMQKRQNGLDYIQKYIDLCIEMGVTCRVVVDFYKRRRANSYVSSVGTYPIITYHTISLNSYERFVKRCIDIACGLVGVILASPFMLITAIAIKIDSPGPVFFKQTRVGQNGRLFKCWKFRSMYMDAEARKAELMAQNEMAGGVMFKMKDDPRVTKVGKVIRKLSIDELPQFFNVLGGTMSMVGTRPPTVDEVEKYERGQWRRISIKPGITGMWQVSGRSNVKTFDEVVQMDVEYIDNWSILMDFKIMFKTVAVLFEHDGAY